MKLASWWVSRQPCFLQGCHFCWRNWCAEKHKAELLLLLILAALPVQIFLHWYGAPLSTPKEESAVVMVGFVLSFVSRRPFQLCRRTRKRKQIPFSDPLQTKSMMGHPSKENQRPHPLGLPSERSNLCSHAARRLSRCRMPPSFRWLAAAATVPLAAGHLARRLPTPPPLPP